MDAFAWFAQPYGANYLQPNDSRCRMESWWNNRDTGRRQIKTLKLWSGTIRKQTLELIEQTKAQRLRITPSDPIDSKQSTELLREIFGSGDESEGEEGTVASIDMAHSTPSTRHHSPDTGKGDIQGSDEDVEPVLQPPVPEPGDRSRKWKIIDSDEKQE